MNDKPMFINCFFDLEKVISLVLRLLSLYICIYIDIYVYIHLELSKYIYIYKSKNRTVF